MRRWNKILTGRWNGLSGVVLLQCQCVQNWNRKRVRVRLHAPHTYTFSFLPPFYRLFVLSYLLFVLLRLFFRPLFPFPFPLSLSAHSLYCMFLISSLRLQHFSRVRVSFNPVPSCSVFFTISSVVVSILFPLLSFFAYVFPYVFPLFPNLHLPLSAFPSSFKLIVPLR